MNRILPFTASQWQQLEHQALIFKYIVSGIPVPSHLLFSLHTTSLSSNFLSPHSQHAAAAAWGCFQMEKKIDPEPGRCRRTDGKKWRCAKEAYPDSKYCQRHIHRGKGRSRKHVELLLLLNNTPSPKTTTTPQSHNPNPSSYLDTQHFRNPYNVKDGVDEHAFLCEPSSATTRSFSAASSMGTNSSSTQREYSCLELQTQTHLFHGVPLVKNETGGVHEPNKKTHRFFDEEPIRRSSTSHCSIQQGRKLDG